MLVVLVLAALISTLLLEGLSYVAQLRSRFLMQLSDLQQGAIQESWFRHTSAALVIDYPDNPDLHLFKGEELQFSGLTLAGLESDAGVPTPFGWQLINQDNTTVLYYQRSNGATWEVTRWAGTMGSFQYLSSDGQWYKQWPPQIMGVEPTQLPRAIVLQGQRRQTPFTWLVIVTGRDTPKPDYRVLDAE